jgi:type VI secretion system protein ImpL
VPLSSRYGLSQHDRMLSASDAAYHTALERLFRPRLLYRLEEQLNARLTEPAFVYETLKVYLMLGGLHPPEKEIIKSWMQRDWADNLYPGSTNAEGRRLLEEHLAAMFDLDTEQPPLVELDGRLIAEAQSSLARLSIAQRAYEFLKSEARASTTGDWIVTRKGGPDVPVVFETASGQPVDTVRVPAFFTYNGFQQMFITQLGGLSERMKRDRWVLGDAGQQEAVGQQYNELAGDLINIYSNDFVASWRTALGNLKLRKVLSDKPKYDILRALSAPTSPLRQILESIRDETMLTKERPKAAGAPGVVSAASTALAAASPTLFNAQDGPPGAKIEAQFKPFHSVLEGDSTRRPIDSIIANLNDIAQNLTLMIENPQMTAQAAASLQTQVAALRNNAARMPPPFSDMLRGAAAEFEGTIAASTAGQLLQTMRDQVTPVCQQTITNRYPFVRAGTQEVQLGDFAKLFSPNGIIDRFFTQYLAPYADTSHPDWTWRKESPVGRSLSADTLKQFQTAAYIRDAFFQTGGSMPTVSFSIKPPTPPGSGVEIKTEIGGTTIASPGAPASTSLFGSSPAPTPAPSTTPTTVQWPGPSTRTAISVSNEVGPPSVLERTGPWSLFRLLEAGSLTVKAETAKATFIVAGRELNYQITTGSVRNPLNLATLREFRCPSGI